MAFLTKPTSVRILFVDGMVMVAALTMTMTTLTMKEHDNHDEDNNHDQGICIKYRPHYEGCDDRRGGWKIVA
jgi:hypothetical protein